MTPKKRRQPVSPRRRKVAKKAVRKRIVTAVDDGTAARCYCQPACPSWVAVGRQGHRIFVGTENHSGINTGLLLSPASARRLAAALMKLAKGGRSDAT